MDPDLEVKVGFSRAGMEVKSDKAIRPKENDRENGGWIRGIEDETMELAEEEDEKVGKGRGR